MTADVLTTHGLTNAAHIVTAATTTGVPLHVLAAMFEKESHGRNVYGNDRGGVYSTTDPLNERPVPNVVTEASFTRLEQRVAAGATSNGVGPAQITYPAYFPQARKQGVRLWVPGENILFGAKILAGHLKGRVDDQAIREAGTLYNKGNLRDGVNAYGHNLVKKAKTWADRLTPPEETTVPDLWLPGIKRVTPTNQAPIPLGLQGKGKRLFTWHTFEADYNLTATRGAEVTNNAGSTPTFCFNPVTGELVQQLPANVGCRTLKANGPSQHTNAYGDVHMQVEVIGYARRPFTLDLTAAGAASLVRLMNFLRSWGIPDQWAWEATVRPAATYAEANARGYRGQPDRSGHAFHSGWWANDHWDPGAIVAPWLVTPAPADPKPDPNKGFPIEHLERVESLLDAIGYDGADVWARVRAYQEDHGLYVDGLPGMTETTPHLEDTMSKLDEILAAVNAGPDRTRDRILRYKNEGQGNTDLYGFIVSAYRASAEAAGHAAAAEAALQSLAGQTDGIDPQVVLDAARRGAQEALAALDFQVTAVTATPTTGQEAV